MTAEGPDQATGTQAPRTNFTRGSMLLAARAAWIAVFLVAAGLLTASIPGHYEALETVCKAEPCVAGQLSPEEMRALGDLGLSVQFNAAYRIALDLMVAAGFCAVGWIIFWRKPADGGALFVSFALMVFGLTWPDIFDSARFNPVWGWLAGFLTQLGLTSLFVFFFVFPDGRFVPRWTRWVVPLALVMPFIALLFPGSLLVDPPQAINLSGFVALWMCCLLAQIYR
ncbi:MAG: hypothetical protein H0V83_09780, partial [Rubrobacter sp.]|nr:hypothetical protein [Rubrobacter sp.]